MDASLTVLGNAVEDLLAEPSLDGPNFGALEDLVAACRQAASLQPDGTSQPAARCEAIAAQLAGMVEAAAGGGGNGSSCGAEAGALASSAAAPAATPLPPAAPSTESSRGSEGGSDCGSPRWALGASPLTAETQAYAGGVARLVRRKLAELRATLPGRPSDGGGSGASTPHAGSGSSYMSIDDFEILKPISRGAFGRVYLARKRGEKGQEPRFQPNRQFPASALPQARVAAAPAVLPRYLPCSHARPVCHQGHAQGGPGA